MEKEIFSNLKRSKRSSNSSSEVDEPTVELSCEQRKPNEGEPVCIICGRYGAYICDTYEVDICSKECKSIYHAKNTESSIRSHLLQKPCSSKITKIPKTEITVTNYSKDQKIALPIELSCVHCCVKVGVKNILDCGKVCSLECMDAFLSPDVILQSPKFTVHSDLSLFSAEQNGILRQTLEVHILEGDAPPVILDFKQANLNIILLENMGRCGYLNPTAVQSQTIPVVLDGSDTLVCSGTGTGKTGSYLIPIIHRTSFWVEHISKNDIFTLVLLPTRDMALQVESMAKDLCLGIPHMRTGILIGGMSSTQQNYRLESGIQIVIATPGRLLELKPDLSKCFTIVIDECDVLLDSSFHEQVKSVIRLLPSRHQTLMFSATISDEIRSHAKHILYYPVQINVGKPGHTIANVKQIVLWIENDIKKKKLISILQDTRFNTPPVLVFVESKFGALLLADFLISKDILCGVIHGEKSQEDRNKIISELKSGRYPVLVSTNILGRGMNMSLSNVILFDMPSTIEQYIHQVGRAFNRQKSGTVFVFINSSNKAVFSQFYDFSLSCSINLPVQLSNSPHLAFQKENKNLSSVADGEGYYSSHKRPKRENNKSL